MIKEELEIYHDFIQKSGGRKSLVRDEIVHQFLKREGHVSAELFYRELLEQDIKVGRATVFRTLALLVSAGLARPLVHSDGVLYYEHCFNHALHGHLICQECGSVTEFTHPAIDTLVKDVKSRGDFQVKACRFSFFGLCERCGKK